jgi:hypothetical protein
VQCQRSAANLADSGAKLLVGHVHRLHKSSQCNLLNTSNKNTKKKKKTQTIQRNSQKVNSSASKLKTIVPKQEGKRKDNSRFHNEQMQ